MASTDTLTASTDTLTASTDPLTASKALSRPLQSTSTQLACNRESQVLSHGCESVVEAVRELYTLAASLGSPTITMSTLTAFISTLMASTGIFMNFHELNHSHKAYSDIYGPLQHSHSSATVS